ncbi:TonB-dependent receptor domain-containing protein [Sphingomonas koreensis]
MASSPAVRAGQAERASYDLPAQPLAQSLRAVALRSGRNILAPAALVRGHEAPALKGDYSIEEALAVLLAGAGLRARAEGATFLVEQAKEGGADTGAAETIDEVLVTGSRIRGGNVASPVIRITRQAMRDSGQSNLGDVVRGIPQSFGGGQNPGVGANVPSASGVNVGGGSSINLRGIGSDATLTLLNGRRMSYSSSRQSIDVSAIPLGAVDRIEIVPDGASALYGSDAVAGVANVILRRDSDTYEMSARLGASTDGGNFEQRYAASAGRRWDGGGFIASYEYSRTTAIHGRDRSYAADKSPALTLFPPLRNQSGVVSGHQALAPGLTIELDLLYNKRWSIKSVANNAAGDVRLSGIVNDYAVTSLALAPTLRVEFGDWRAFSTGSYGRDRNRFTVTTWSRGVPTTPPQICYCNSARTAEVGADGPLFALPGGPVRLALGGGYRSNRFIRDNGPGNAQNIDRTQDSYYGYGELNVPLVAPGQAIPLAHRLSLSAALRYENYPGIGDIATPKLGIAYAPTPDFEIKGSWGRSFRAPTLLEKYQPRALVLIAPSALGGTGYPADRTALFVQGGNADLKPERARTWSATLAIHPRALDGAELELSYFDIDYRDRVVAPIAFIAQSLSNPAYRDQVITNPNAGLLAQIVGSALSFVNATGLPYDPGKVAVLIDGSSVNAGRQSIRGVDMLVRYRVTLDGGSSLGATLNASYLESSQQISSSQPTLPLAGRIFNPPHFRARGALSWDSDRLNLTASLNYTGGVDDPRKMPVFRVGSMTTLDFAARYQPQGMLRGFEVSLALLNLLNAKPTPIATSQFSDTPYDSTNYSPVGRFVSLTVRKTW